MDARPQRDGRINMAPRDTADRVNEKSERHTGDHRGRDRKVGVVDRDENREGESERAYKLCDERLGLHELLLFESAYGTVCWRGG
jgi:hypothetical protein